MSKTVSLHSLRGGTGKTVIGVNLAVMLAKKGLDVALLDLDFRAPSLYHVFKQYVGEPPFWVNDYLNGRCKPDDLLIDVNSVFNSKGNLSVGFADPRFGALEDMLGKSGSWQARALDKLFRLKKFLAGNMNVDLCICDTGPGIHYSSLNAMVHSDQIVFVSTLDPLEIEQVKDILSEYPDIFGNKTFILLNKAFPETDRLPDEKQREFMSRLSADIKDPVIGMIPCYCDVLRTQRRLLIFEKPHHPFLSDLEEIAQKLIGNYEKYGEEICQIA